MIGIREPGRGTRPTKWATRAAVGLLALGLGAWAVSWSVWWVTRSTNPVINSNPPIVPPDQVVHRTQVTLGEQATDFTLPSIDGAPLTLSEFRGRRPLVLILGSPTCDLFCGRVPELVRLRKKYRDRVKFLFVSITEAGHRVPGLEHMFAGGLPTAATPLAERVGKVQTALKKLEFEVPAVIDKSDREVESVYMGYPTRLYAIDADGVIDLDLGRSILGEPWDLVGLERWLADQPE